MTQKIMIPVTVVNGFLGSGKTTIISHLLDDLIAKREKVAYVKNEIGEFDLDSQLMSGKNIFAKELLNGCICCTLIGPFIDSINELISTYHPDRIIIESAGSADPTSVALTVDNHPELSRDGVITVVDVVNFNGYEKINQVVKRQAEFTDLIIFNKVELATSERKKQVVGYVREVNEKTPIIEAINGKISPDLIFGLDSRHLSQLDEHHHDHNHPDHHVEDEINAFTYQNPKNIDRVKLEALLNSLPKNIFRVKGYFSDQGKIWLVNRVFNRNDFVPLTNLITGSKLIFIGYQAQDSQSEIVNALEKL